MLVKIEVHPEALQDLHLHRSKSKGHLYNTTDEQDGQTDNRTDIILLHAHVHGVSVSTIKCE